MAHQALYNKWRPRTFAQTGGQEHITQTLLHALQSGRITHAYLFSGPRGTGKTTTARVLAKAVNCLNNDGRGEPCNECDSCQAFNSGRSLDLIEIDAASNRGIDEIRDLREKVGYAPSQAKYKVYIIDEVHMLTTEAFNALLKTLEEPPPHAIFILATTEFHKVPATIVSRCQHFPFRRVPLAKLLDRLRFIGQEEGLQVDDDALELIGRAAAGSYRDAISLLDQLAAFGGERLTLSYVQTVLGMTTYQSVGALVDHLLRREVSGGIQLINQVMNDGADLRQFNRQLVDYLRGLLLIKSGNAQLVNVTRETLEEMTAQATQTEAEAIVRQIKIFNQADWSLRGNTQPQLPLELAFLEAMAAEQPAPPARPNGVAEGAPAAAGPALFASASKKTALVAARPLARNGALFNHTRPAPAPPPAVSEEGGDLAGPGLPALTMEQVAGTWGKLLEEIRPGNRSIEALLKACEPVGVEDGVVVLGFYWQFHKERIEDPKNKAIVERALSKLLGRPSRIHCVIAPKGSGMVVPTEVKPAAVAEDAFLKAAAEMGAVIEEVPEGE
ncbi:MAG: DNA polymerase III subunit gamma/tau [Chloroflexi bacterium]|nr:DNA polymerase III subunit gamma/tau [Chloroflexota bacterium]